MFKEIFHADSSHQKNAFSHRWDWEKVFYYWQKRLNDFNVKLNPLFETLRVHDPKNPSERLTSFYWWRVNSVRKLHMDRQRYLLKWPGTSGFVHSRGDKRIGEIDTMNHLWKHKDDPEMIAAILIAGSLFSRMNNPSSAYPKECWPPAHCASQLADIAHARWAKGSTKVGWPLQSTQIMPIKSIDYDYKIETMGALVRYLAEEHASLLLRYRLVAMEYAEKPDPFIARALKEEFDTDRLRFARLEAELRRRNEERRRQQQFAPDERLNPKRDNRPRFRIVEPKDD